MDFDTVTGENIWNKSFINSQLVGESVKRFHERHMNMVTDFRNGVQSNNQKEKYDFLSPLMMVKGIIDYILYDKAGIRR